MTLTLVIMQLEDVLDDLCARFIINLPEEERASFERLGFQVEQAFWFYDDFYRPAHPHLPRLTLRTFGKVLLLRYPPLIAPFGRDFDRLYDEFIAYKQSIPVCGAIILNERRDKCLLVKGWSSKASWGFPKGKIGKDENPADCAVREVFEETGFDIGKFLNSTDYIDAMTSTAKAQATRLFIVSGIPEGTEFVPQTRKEISKISWHRIQDLPTKYGQNNSYYNVVHFVNKLKNWIKINKQHTNKDYNAESSSHKKAKIPKTKLRRNDNASKKLTANEAAVPVVGEASDDLWHKLRTASLNQKANSVFMRDNASPLHLFEKLDSVSAKDEASVAVASTEVSPQSLTLISMGAKSTAVSSQKRRKLEMFCQQIREIKVSEHVISAAIDKVLNKYV